jgi:hypothetical protein
MRGHPEEPLAVRVIRFYAVGEAGFTVDSDRVIKLPNFSDVGYEAFRVWRPERDSRPWGSSGDGDGGLQWKHYCQVVQVYYRPMLTAAYLGTLTINPTTTVITYIHTSTYLIYLLTYLPTSLHTYLFIHAYLHTYFPNNIPDPSTFVIIIIIIYQPTSLTNLLTTTYNRYFL